MLINLIGNISIDTTPTGLYIGSEESGIYIHPSESTLTSPLDYFLRFHNTTSRIYKHYKGIESRIVSGNNEWSTDDLFIGANEKYCVFRSLDADGNKRYETKDWNGATLGLLPFLGHDKYFSDNWIALSEGKLSYLFTPQGTAIEKLELASFSVGVQKPIFFTNHFAFFKKEPGKLYQIYDINKKRFLSSIPVDEAIFDVFQLPSGAIVFVDAQGIKKLESNFDQTTPVVLYRFEFPLNIRVTKVSLWCDEIHAYAAINYDYELQILISLDLSEKNKPNMLTWSPPWVMNFGGGFISGYNYLQLRRKDLLSDNAILLWRAGDSLSENLLDADLSPSITVSREKSTTKGKHCYKIYVKDDSCSRALRSAAHELGRLLSESCSGPYNESESLKDRKFDGQFHIEINTCTEPNEFERDFLPAYIRHFRDYGGLSPTGSKTAIAEPSITWQISAK